jgi:hypothetical protein
MNMLEAVNHWATVIGLVLTAIGLIAIAFQRFLDRKVARNNFMLRLYELHRLVALLRVVRDVS